MVLNCRIYFCGGDSVNSDLLFKMFGRKNMTSLFLVSTDTQQSRKF